jgi:mannose-6-phosphate isomerase-like protein (cupin superfamily)
LKRNIENAEHYRWGDRCDGWILAPSPDMTVIQERMPPATAERRHFHTSARQFFYVLSGELTMEPEATSYLITTISGIEVPPGTRHQARSESGSDVNFLVVSSTTTRGDRTDLDDSCHSAGQKLASQTKQAP